MVDVVTIYTRTSIKCSFWVNEGTELWPTIKDIFLFRDCNVYVYQTSPNQRVFFSQRIKVWQLPEFFAQFDCKVFFDWHGCVHISKCHPAKGAQQSHDRNSSAELCSYGGSEYFSHTVIKATVSAFLLNPTLHNSPIYDEYQTQSAKYLPHKDDFNNISRPIYFRKVPFSMHY